MIPGGMDPKKMQAMMRQMGIKSEDIAASKVIIETSSNSIIIEQPQVVQVTMQGQTSFQISGQVRREARISEEDVKMVMEQAGCSEDAAKAALEKSQGDIAQAILSLSEGK
ncbi:MAG: nascent polypeptide-associated complex protein [Candidatus Micrarchaeota archaeon]